MRSCGRLGPKPYSPSAPAERYTAINALMTDVLSFLIRPKA